MYEIFKNVINSQVFELSDMLKKLNTAWVRGDITEEQYNELVPLAREKADPTMSLDLSAQVQDLEMRVRDLQTRVTKLEEGGGGVDPKPPVDEWPEWEVHKVYYNGDKVTFQGKHYICTLPEHTPNTTWSPADYPPYWTEQP